MRTPRNAGAEAIAYAVRTYRENDPAASVSGTEAGIMRRTGRRDACVGVVAAVMQVTDAEARTALESLAAQPGVFAD